MPSNHLILCRPLLLLPSIFPSIRVFSNKSVLRFRWPKYWSFSFNISPSNDYSGLISFRLDWSDLLAVQGTLESLLQPPFTSSSSSALHRHHRHHRNHQHHHSQGSQIVCRAPCLGPCLELHASHLPATASSHLPCKDTEAGRVTVTYVSQCLMEP